MRSTVIDSQFRSAFSANFRQRGPASAKIEVRLGLRLSQAQPNGRRRPAFGAVSSTATWAEHRHQNFRRFAAYRTIGLNGANGGDGCVAFVTLIAFVTLFPLGTRRTLRALRTLRARLALRSCNALHALGPLRASRPLRTWFALGPRILAACAKCQSHTDCEYRENPHVTPPMISVR